MGSTAGQLQGTWPPQATGTGPQPDGLIGPHTGRGTEAATAPFAFAVDLHVVQSHEIEWGGQVLQRGAKVFTTGESSQNRIRVPARPFFVWQPSARVPVAAYRDVPCWPTSVATCCVEQATGSNQIRSHMKETDLPCSDCGTELVERTIDTHELPLSTAADCSVRLAECPSCGARYYPEQTLSKLSGRRNDPTARGDS